MKILISTSKTQGQRKSDFNWTKEGELVKFGFECDTDKRKIDGKCGCRRSMVGLDTAKGTTTFKVIDMSISHKDYVHRIKDSFVKTGWGEVGIDIIDMSESDAIQLEEIANHFSVNTILEKRGDKFVERKKC